MTNQENTASDFKPVLEEQELVLLRRLTSALAVSGDEQEVREIVREVVSPAADQVETDALGNLLVTKRGKGENLPRVMIAAHMDEVGFMLIRDEGDGIFQFEVVGGIDERQLAGKSVIVGRQHIPGVIGTKAIHLTTPEERKRTLGSEQLRIDLGPGGSSLAKVGDRATFATQLKVAGPSILSKALDDRLGVFNLIQLVLHAPENVDLLAAFTVQEEVGLRGAKVASYHFDPQIGIALDSTPAHDLPHFDGEENYRYNTHLDGGPAIYLMDGATIADRRLVRWLVESAQAEGIPWQYRQPNKGGTDAGSIHKIRAGVPSVSVSVPQRYLHSAAGLVRMDDCINTLRLVYGALTRLDASILNRQEN